MNKNLLNFGYETKNQSYQLDTSTTFCNHGSYGAVPNVIFNRKNELQHEIEHNPDKWFRITSFKMWLKNKREIAEYLNVNDENILICDNATESINCVLKSIEFKGSRDAILCTQYTYGGKITLI